MVRNKVKMDNHLMFDCFFYLTKRFLHAISARSSFNLFQNACERSWVAPADS